MGVHAESVRYARGIDTGGRMRERDNWFRENVGNSSGTPKAQRHSTEDLNAGLAGLTVQSEYTESGQAAASKRISAIEVWNWPPELPSPVIHTST